MLEENLVEEPTIEFVASVTDLAGQTTFVPIVLNYAIEPKFSSSLFYVSILSSEFRVPMDVFRFELVDAFHRPLNSTRFQLVNQSETFAVQTNQLIVRQAILPLQVYRLKILGFWQNFTCETFVEVRLVQSLVPVEKKLYEIHLNASSLRDNTPLQRFNTKNLFFSLIETPLTRDRCLENFRLEGEYLLFQSKRNVSSLSRCFFEIRVAESFNIESIFIDVRFLSLERTDVNGTATTKIEWKRRDLPTNIGEEVERCPNVPVVLSDLSLPGTVIQDVRSSDETSNRTDYFLFAGDRYGLFSLNKVGQLFLQSSKLNRTRDEVFSLTILISSTRKLSFCRTNITVGRKQRLICPPMPVRWTVDEETPLGTVIGRVSTTLLELNDNEDVSKLVIASPRIKRF